MKNILGILFIMLLVLRTSHGQKLVPPLEDIPMSRQAYLLLKNGEFIEGKILYVHSGRGITKVALKDEDGQKHAHKAVDIEEFAIVSTALVKLQYYNEGSESVKKWLNTDYGSIDEQDFVIFKNTNLKSGKAVLLQLLNPHFDEQFQVFYDPFARKSTPLRINKITLTGEMHRAYYVSKGGGPITKVKKETYRKSFLKLFGDCPAFLQMQEVKFKDLGSHIFFYTQNCGPDVRL